MIKKPTKVNINSEDISYEDYVVKVTKDVEKVLAKYNISAIIKIPDVEVKSIFQSHGDKLEILEYVDIENRMKEQLIKKEVDNTTESEICRNNSRMRKLKMDISPSYIR